MRDLKTLLWRFVKDEQGDAAIEYGLIAALIGVALIAGASELGLSLNQLLDNIATRIKMSVA